MSTEVIQPARSARGNELSRTGTVVTKRATTDAARLLAEAEWLRSVPDAVKAHVPTVIDIRSGPGFAEYDMPYQPWPTLADLLISDVPPDDLEGRLSAALTFCARAIHGEERATVPGDYVRASYLEKIVRRLSEAGGSDTSLGRVVGRREITIDGRTHLSPLAVARAVGASPVLIGRLTPPCLSLFHGDFKLDNVMVEPQGDGFCLIDPRGGTEGGSRVGDPIEDYAKLRTDTRSGYHLARLGLHRAEEDGDGSFRLVQRFPAGTAAALARLDRVVLTAAERAHRPDPAWSSRLEFIEGVLLVANSSFQLWTAPRDPDDVALALYLKGTVILSDWLRANAAPAEASR